MSSSTAKTCVTLSLQASQFQLTSFGLEYHGWAASTSARFQEVQFFSSGLRFQIYDFRREKHTSNMLQVQTLFIRRRGQNDCYCKLLQTGRAALPLTSGMLGCRRWQAVQHLPFQYRLATPREHGILRSLPSTSGI